MSTLARCKLWSLCSNCTYDAPSRNVCSAVLAMFRPTLWRRTLRVASRISSSNACLCLCVARCLAICFRVTNRRSKTLTSSWPSPARYFRHTGQYTSRPPPYVSRYVGLVSLTILARWCGPSIVRETCMFHAPRVVVDVVALELPPQQSVLKG